MSGSHVRKAVVPAAGKGTRLLPATLSQPKEMLPVGRKPTIQYVVEELAEAGIDNILIVTGRGKRALEDHFDVDEENVASIDFPKVNVFYVRQSIPLGLADAVSRAKEFVQGEPFIVALGDSIIDSKVGSASFLHRMLELHDTKKCQATIALETVKAEEVHRYGVVKPGMQQGDVVEVVDLVEKPRSETAPSRLAIAARYVFEPVIFDMIASIAKGVGGEYQLTDAIKALLRADASVWGLALGEGDRRFDIGNFLSYWDAFFQMCIEDPEIGAVFAERAKNHLK